MLLLLGWNVFLFLRICFTLPIYLIASLSFFIFMFHLLPQLAKDDEHNGPSDQPFLRQHKKVRSPIDLCENNSFRFS